MVLQVSNDFGVAFKVEPFKDLLVVDMRVRESLQNYSNFLPLNISLLFRKVSTFLSSLYSLPISQN